MRTDERLRVSAIVMFKYSETTRTKLKLKRKSKRSLRTRKFLQTEGLNIRLIISFDIVETLNYVMSVFPHIFLCPTYYRDSSILAHQELAINAYLIRE